MGSDGVFEHEHELDIISIHAPRMGSDKFLHVHLYPWQFQSTLPGWGATLEDLGYPISDEISIHAPRMGSDGTACCRVSADCNFNPRSPDGERLWAITGNYNAQVISIHAPRMGSDRDGVHKFRQLLISIHAPRMGSDPTKRLMISHGVRISIHAPRMGSDPAMVRRSPDGERPGDGSPLPGRSIFQSTLPGWGATIGTPATRADVIEFQSTLPGDRKSVV